MRIGEASGLHIDDLDLTNCVVLGAEVFASESETKLVCHTCKSRLCTSCGHRATEQWQEDLNSTLPDVPYVGITLTMPEFRPILKQNRRLLHGIPTMGAEAIQQWAKARYGVRLIILVVQQTYGGLLNFCPHLHVMVSAGGLQESTNRWIPHLKFDKDELMKAWRYALVAFLGEACKRRLAKGIAENELLSMLQFQYKRDWIIHIGRSGSKEYRLKHDGRYVGRLLLNIE